MKFGSPFPNHYNVVLTQDCPAPVPCARAGAPGAGDGRRLPQSRRDCVINPWPLLPAAEPLNTVQDVLQVVLNCGGISQSTGPR